EKGEITEAERRKLTRTASAKLDELVQNYSYPYAAELCELYVKGAKVEWNELYKGQKRRRLNLPVYLLERTRYWYEEKNPAVQTSRETAAAKIKEISHPLVDRCLVESLYHDVYTTIFRADRQWVLKDHKILESHVIPGTTYIEMAIEVCKKYYGSQMEIKDIIYFSPVIVEENEEREVHSILFKCKDHIEVTFASRINTGDINEQWIKHVECKVYKSADTQGRVFDIEKIKENLMSPSGEEQLIHMEQKEVGVELGERWQNEKIVAVGRSEALVVLELPEHIAYDQSQFCLHVSMLDNAVNAISQKIGQGLYLPFFYKSIKVTGKMSSKVYSYIRVKGKPHKEAETVTFDVSLMDSLGRVFAEVSDYSIKKVNETEYRQREIALKSNVYFDLGWIENEPSGNMKDLKDANILIFADRNGIADGLPEKLEAEGCSVIEVKIGNKFEKVSENEYSIAGEEEDYKLLFEELADRKLTHILHLMTISGGKEANSLEKLEEKQKLGIYSLLYMTKALVAAKFSKEIDIVLVSDYANDVTKTEKQLDPANGAFLGMGKTITLEHSNLRCSCIDLDESNSIDSILKELKTAEKTSKVAYRNGKRFVEELRKLELDKSADNKLTIRENGVYLITGGAGGLGLEMGKLLAAKNKVKIALVNRSQVPARKLWDEILDKAADKKLCRTITAIREIERLGSQVSCFSSDVSNHEEMQSVMNLIKSESGPVNGIIHCAGVAGDGFMMRKDKKTFDSVVSPKVTGTWILDQLTCKDTIDFFVMFSSILSIFGDPGQGDYTAANAYMDVFAAYRQRQGKKTIAINWPAWKDTGMAVDYHIREEDTVVKPVSTQKAIRAFEEILESQSCRVLPGDLNYLKLSDIRDDLQFRLSSQIQDVLDKHKAKAKVENEGAVTSERDEKALIKGRGSDDYNETENKLAQIWSQVLGLNEIDIFDSFSSLGGDSMMAIQLLKEITKVFKDTIDITDIFTHPSVQQMSEYIDEKLGNRKEGKKTAKANEAEISDNSLKSMLDGLESGETSIENVMKMLGSN
ncbi:MAG TPA: SDR family NAD(P)-dependent oxidoreductase, partial [Clostridia bacterium]|nr:SDR family NAD(P)-dependent oxidoreductase [Clostridia bacterium]